MLGSIEFFATLKCFIIVFCFLPAEFWQKYAEVSELTGHVRTSGFYGIFKLIDLREKDLLPDHPLQAVTTFFLYKYCAGRALKNSVTQLDPATWMMLPTTWPRAGFAPFSLQLHDTQHRSNMSVFVWNLYWDRKSYHQVTSHRNQNFKQHDKSKGIENKH